MAGREKKIKVGEGVNSGKQLMKMWRVRWEQFYDSGIPMR